MSDALEQTKALLLDSNYKCNAAMNKARIESGRLRKLADLVWESRYVSNDEDYQNLVAISAEVRSQNFESLDRQQS